jgi:hypothetical protein
MEALTLAFLPSFENQGADPAHTSAAANLE